jgi:large subunit ribosomal protein L23
MQTLHDIVVSPILTEKSSLLKEDNNTVAFKVAKNANKIQIKEAVEKLFKVKVLDVRSAIVRGKRKRVGRNIGMTSNYKKAYVTLSKDSKISFFEGV